MIKVNEIIFCNIYFKGNQTNNNRNSNNKAFKAKMLYCTPQAIFLATPLELGNTKSLILTVI